MKIERGIPPPSPRVRYNLASRKVGDSFLVPLEKGPSIRAAASQAHRAGKGTFVTATEYDKAGTPIGVRCWRVRDTRKGPSNGA